MKKFSVTLAAILSVALLVEAHEFWLETNKFFLNIGERVAIKFMVGENFTGEEWDLNRHKVERLELNELSGTRSIIDSVKKELGIMYLTFKEAGTKLVVMQSDKAYLELDGKKFNEYLKEDGLDEIYALREKTKTLEKGSKEFYSRHTKLLLSVGDKMDDTYNKVIGLPIEIVPEKHPYTLKKGDLVRMKVLFEGKPLFGAKVRLWNRFDNRTTIQNIFTGQNGTIEMRISNPGPWMVSVVKMVPSKDPKADWQSYWGSLVFGIK